MTGITYWATFIAQLIVAIIGENKNTTILDAQNSGMGIIINNGDPHNFEIHNLTITNGNANDGAALYLNALVSAVINNCIIYNNIVGIRNWTYCFGDYTNQYFHYSLFYGNNSDVYEDGTAGSWMVYFQNCLFVNPDFNDPTNNDFTLQSTSPCINAGNPSSSFNDPDGTRNDIGAMYYKQ